MMIWFSRVLKWSEYLDWWLLNWILGRRRAVKGLPSSSNPAIKQKKMLNSLTWFKKTKRELLALLPFLWRRGEPQERLVLNWLCSLHFVCVSSLGIQSSSAFCPKTFYWSERFFYEGELKKWKLTSVPLAIYHFWTTRQLLTLAKLLQHSELLFFIVRKKTIFT